MIRPDSARTLAAFHRANQHRAQHWPHAMLATSTHDTKRGEDARARLAALSEISAGMGAPAPGLVAHPARPRRGTG